jgi:hypothetical protein
MLLVVAGGAKLARPTPAANALAAVLGPARPPGPGSTGARRRGLLKAASLRRAVRALAVIEIAAGAVAIARPSPAGAGIVAGIYVCFAGFVVVARGRGGPLTSCGCLGVADTPATRLHMLLNLAYAGSAIAVAVGARSAWLPDLLRQQPALGIPLVMAAALLAMLTALAMTRLPRLLGVRAALAGATAGTGAGPGTVTGPPR